MPFYDIAGLVVEIKHPTGRTEKQARPYLCKDQEGQTADMTIDVTEQRVTDAMAEHPEMNRDDWYYMLTGSDFYTQLLKFRGILLHSSCVVVDGVAYAFSADSGTGKSTHTALWLKHFGNRAYMLNDDKPAIRLVGDRVYACGTPGAENMITPPRAWFPWRAFASSSGRRRILSTRQTPKRQYSTFSPKRCASWGLTLWSDCLICWRPSSPRCPCTNWAATSAMTRCAPLTTP